MLGLNGPQGGMTGAPMILMINHCRDSEESYGSRGRRGGRYGTRSRGRLRWGGNRQKHRRPQNPTKKINNWGEKSKIYGRGILKIKNVEVGTGSKL